MSKIEIGDLVIFYDTIEKRMRRGQVVNIYEDDCEVYVTNEASIYFVKLSMVKKL